MNRITPMVALVRLMESHPDSVVTELDWQLSTEGSAAGPWVLVTFDGTERYAIWKLTGAVYRMEGGAVDDDPIAVAPSAGDRLELLCRDVLTQCATTGTPSRQRLREAVARARG